MAREIDGIEQVRPANDQEVFMFSYLMHKINECNDFGTINFKITVRNGKITNIKNISESNYNFH